MDYRSKEVCDNNTQEESQTIQCDHESQDQKGNEQFKKGDAIDSPWELNEKDRFIFNDKLYKIIRKRKRNMVVRRMADKKRIVINR